jgi:MFS family permease
MLVNFGASPFLIASVAAMYFIPGIVLSPFSGSIVDRIEVKKLMVILLSVELIMTLCFMLINSLDDIWLLLLLLFIRMGSSSMFFTTEMTLLPKLLSGEALVKANEIHSIIWSFTFTAGMAIGGIVVSIYGVKISFIIDGIFFIVALGILSQIHFNVEVDKVHKSIINSIKDGVNYIKRNKYLIHYMILHATVGLTAFDTLVTLLADYEYKFVLSVPLAIGITNAMRAFALMIGPLLISNWISKERMFYVFIAQGLSIIIWAFVQNDFYLGLIGMFLTGIVTTTIWSYTYAMLQDRVEGQYLGRVLAYNEMIFMLGNVITTFFIGIMASFVSLNIISIILGLSFIVVAYYYKRVFL